MRREERLGATLSPFFLLFFRRALRAAGLLRLVAVPERGRVSLARGQLQVHVCTWLHRAELRGRHRRVRQGPVHARYLQEHPRVLQVSRNTTADMTDRATVVRCFFSSLFFISRLRETRLRDMVRERDRNSFLITAVRKMDAIIIDKMLSHLGTYWTF